MIVNPSPRPHEARQLELQINLPQPWDRWVGHLQ